MRDERKKKEYSYSKLLLAIHFGGRKKANFVLWHINLNGLFKPIEVDMP